MNNLAQAQPIVGRRLTQQGKRSGRKYSRAVTDLLKDVPAAELTPAQVIRIMHEMCLRYYPTYLRRHPGTQGLEGLPFDISAPLDTSWKAFCEVGQWLVNLHEGRIRTRAEWGPNVQEVQWIFTQTKLRLEELKQLKEAIK